MQLEKLSDTQCQPESQLKFIIEAWQQVTIIFFWASGHKLVKYVINLLLLFRIEFVQVAYAKNS